MKPELAMAALHWAHKREEENYIHDSQARRAHMRRVADWAVDDGIGRHDSLTNKKERSLRSAKAPFPQIYMLCFLEGTISRLYLLILSCFAHIWLNSHMFDSRFRSA